MDIQNKFLSFNILVILIIMTRGFEQSHMLSESLPLYYGDQINDLIE